MISDADFKRLLDFFDRPWQGYRKVRKGVKKRIGRHMQQIGCPQMDGYLAALDRQPDARQDCEQHLTVTISRFFRDRKLWDQLGDRVLPDLIHRCGRRIRAWSAGCANGEEAYSLFIVWDRMCAQKGIDAALHIVATDVRADCLQRARRGRYQAGSLKLVPADIRNAYFTPVSKAKQYQLHPKVIQSICYRQHDLLSQQAPGRFHLILLRNNLLTYYRGQAQAGALQRALEALHPQGVLIVGAHEKPPARARLTRDQRVPWIHYKQAGIASEAQW
jgi:chemotaxis protein methyltransferase CheR